MAMELGGFAWEKAGLIWYKALCEELDQLSDFQSAANSTLKVAGDLYGKNSAEQKAVYNGWQAVGIIPAGMETRVGCMGSMKRLFQRLWRRINSI